MINEHKPLVTIILRTHNGKKYIRQAIEACLAQTYPNIELIIVDDGSTDKTSDIIKSFNDQRIVFVKNKKVKKLGAVINQALKRSHGQYVTWIREIDFLLPNAIEEMIHRLLGLKEYIVYADYYSYSFETQERILTKCSDFLDFSDDNTMSPCFLISTKVFEEIGALNPHYEMAADYDFWIRLTKKYQMSYYSQALSMQVKLDYYGRRVDRIYGYLFQRIIRYRNGLIPFNIFEMGVDDFIKRINKFSDSKRHYYFHLCYVLGKIYRISFVTGMLFQYVLLCLLTGSQSNNMLFRLIIKMRIDYRIFWIRQSIKKAKQGVNILCLVPEVVIGGSEKVILDVVRKLTPQGFVFHLMAAAKEENAWCRSFLNAFKNTVLLRKSFNMFDSQTDEEYYAYLKFLIPLLNIKILLISNSLSPYRCLARLKKEFSAIKVVDLLHTAHFYTTNEKTHFAVPFIDRRVCISNGIKEYVVQQYRQGGIDSSLEGKITVIYNGHDTERLKRGVAYEGVFKQKHKLDKDIKILTYIGRLSAEKRPLVFVDIAKQIKLKMPDEKFMFVMAGNGVLKSIVKDRISQHKLEDDFILTGTVDNAEVFSILMDTNILLIVSSLEGLPLVALEAMLMNIPVISTDVGSVKEAIKHSENGYVVPAQENVIDNFVHYIGRLCSSPDEYKRIADNARVSVMEDFSLKTMAVRYKEIFKELVERV